MLKIWGRNTSSNVQKVIWALAEMKLPFERIDVGGAFGRTKDAFYLAMNPNSLVPTLEEEDGFTMWESNSIVRYLAAKHQNRTLEPADLKIRARAQMWMDWQLSVMAPSITPVFWGLIRTPPEKRDPNAIEETTRAWRMIEAKLNHHDFIAGTDFSLCDIPWGVHAHRWFGMDYQGLTRPEMPAVRAWYDRLCQRPAYRQHVMATPIA